MKVIFSAVLVFAAFCSIHCQSEWTEEDVNALKEIISSWISEDEKRAPGSLRYAFHSCTGGCNGCINMEDPGNGGLGETYDALNQLYDETFPFSSKELGMSRADFYALAGIVSVEYTIVLNNEDCGGATECEMKEPVFQYSMGREDCPTAPDYPTDVFVGLPGGFFDHDEVLAFFLDAFGLDPTEATALLGAHTLGRMQRDGSGYKGQWKVDRNLLFNNEYFKFLVNQVLDWVQFDAAEGDGTGDVKWQWEGKSKEDGESVSFMLPADVALVKDIEIMDDGGLSSCEFVDCGTVSTTNLAAFFSRNQDVWLDIFTVAYDKMTTTVSDDLREKMYKPKAN